MLQEKKESELTESSEGKEEERERGGRKKTHPPKSILPLRTSSDSLRTQPEAGDNEWESSGRAKEAKRRPVKKSSLQQGENQGGHR
jgi:hypothetical protein